MMLATHLAKPVQVAANGNKHTPPPVIIYSRATVDIIKKAAHVSFVHRANTVRPALLVILKPTCQTVPRRAFENQNTPHMTKAKGLTLFALGNVMVNIV